MSDWWSEFFDGRVASLILGQPRDGELDFLFEQLGLESGDTFFDQCCGWGRVSGPLMERGLKVYGVDSSAELVGLARERWGLAVEVADATEYLPPGRCQAAANLYSSFGYTTDDDYNQQMLRRLVESVEEGARVLLDTINPHRVLNGFEPLMESAKPCGTIVRRTSELRDSGRCLYQDWTFERPDGESFSKLGGLTRLYTMEELERAFRAVGAEVVGCCGDFQGTPYEEMSERLILVAQR